MPGVPQSATGQASLLTGCNAAEVMGRHVEGLPGPKLKELVRQKNIFSRLKERGYSCAFANAYFTDDMNEVRSRRHQSVTTVAALQAFGEVRDTAAMLGNRAVYQDLTRRFLRGRGYTGPNMTPRESAEHLLAIAAEHDFTLFEYFQTDLMAHKGTPEDVRRVLSQLERVPRRPARVARSAGTLAPADAAITEMSRIPARNCTRKPGAAGGGGRRLWIVEGESEEPGGFCPGDSGNIPTGNLNLETGNWKLGTWNLEPEIEASGLGHVFHRYCPRCRAAEQLLPPAGGRADCPGETDYFDGI